MFNEITRLLNHLMCLTTHALDVGALTPFLWGFEEREYLLSFYERVSGARMHASYFRVGGVWSDIPDFFLNDLSKFISNFLSYIDILEELLSSNPIWISRLLDIGLIKMKSAFDLGFSGPVLRGSGISWDLRKLQPYDSYIDFNFDIPVGILGDCYSRFYVRLCEMRESIKIIFQCIDFLSNLENNINSNIEINNSSYNSLFSFNFFKAKSKISMEELIYHFKNFSEGLIIPKGDIYISIEAPKGETGVFLVSSSSNKPYRCKIRAPGFFHLQGLDLISKDYLLADVVANIGSLDIVFGEIDR